jgi:hypothetical protein
MLAQDNVAMNSLKAPVVFLFCVVMLGGCAQVQLRTAWALKDVDYLTVDPGQFRLALSMPDGALLDKVSMSLQFSHDGVVEIDHDISFDILTSGSEIDRVHFPPTVSNGLVLRLPAARLEEVVAYQRRLQQAREFGESSSASMGIDTRLNQESVARVCVASDGKFRIQAWILVNVAEGYLPLIRDSEMSSLISAQAESFCPQQSTPG